MGVFCVVAAAACAIVAMCIWLIYAFCSDGIFKWKGCWWSSEEYKNCHIFWMADRHSLSMSANS